MRDSSASSSASEGGDSPLSDVEDNVEEADLVLRPKGGELERIHSDEGQRKQDFVRKIFGDQHGEHVGDFSCALDNGILLQGRLYTYSKSILFYSNIFGFTKALHIPWENVQTIVKETTLLIPNAILIISNKHEYIFRSFWDRRGAFKVLRGCHRMSRGLPPEEMGPVTVQEEKKKSKVTRSLSPAKERSPTSMQGGEPAVVGSLSPAQHTKPPPASDKQDSAQYSEAAADVLEDEGAFGFEPVAVEDDDPSKVPDIVDDGQDPSDALAAAEAAIVDRREKSGAKALTMRETLPCSVLDFFHLIVGDAAAPRVISFHEERGDWDVSVTPWRRSKGKLGWTRDVRYVHPFKAPFGPQQTRTVHSQRCRMFGGSGLIVETSVELEDVLLRDFFHVEDQCVVRAGKSKGTVDVEVAIDVLFTRRHLLRGLIETKSLQDAELEWLAKLRMMSRVVSGTAPVMEKRKRRHQVQHRAAHRRSQSGKDVAAAVAVDTPSRAASLFTWGLPWFLLGCFLIMDALRRQTVLLEAERFVEGLLVSESEDPETIARIAAWQGSLVRQLAWPWWLPQ